MATNLGIMGLIVGVIISLMAAYTEHKNPNKNMGRFILWVILSVLFAFLGVYEKIQSKSESDDDKKEIVTTTKSVGTKTTSDVNAVIDTTRQAIFDSMKRLKSELKSQSDSSTDYIIKKTSPIATYPQLNLCNQVYGRSNPSTVEIKGDTITYIVSLCNDGTDIAENIVNYDVIINYLNGKYTYDPNLHRIANKSLIIAPNKPGIIFPISLILPPPNDPTESYIYFRVSYSKKGEQKIMYLRKIFTFDRNRKLKEVPNDKYEEISGELIKNNLW